MTGSAIQVGTEQSYRVLVVADPDNALLVNVGKEGSQLIQLNPGDSVAVNDNAKNVFVNGTASDKVHGFVYR